jgi:hypothetical protein
MTMAGGGEDTIWWCFDKSGGLGGNIKITVMEAAEDSKGSSADSGGSYYGQSDACGGGWCDSVCRLRRRKK